MTLSITERKEFPGWENEELKHEGERKKECINISGFGYDA